MRLGQDSLFVLGQLPATEVVVPKVDAGLVEEPQLVAPSLQIGQLVHELALGLLLLLWVRVLACMQLWFSVGDPHLLVEQSQSIS